MKPSHVFLLFLVLACRLNAGLIYVTNQKEGAGTVVVDPGQWNVRATLAVESRVVPLGVESNGAYGWTLGKDGLSLKRIRLNDGQEDAEVALDITATAIGLASPQGPLVWSARNNTLLHFVDLKSFRRLPQTLNLPGVAELFFARPLSNGAGCAALMVSPAAVALLDFDRLKADIFPLPSPAWDLAFSPDGRFLAASHPLQDEITVRDLSGRKLFKRISLPSGPRGLAFEGPDALWVAHQKDDTGRLSLVDLGGDCVTASIRLVGSAHGLVLLPPETGRGGQLVVSSYIPELDRGVLYAFDPSSKKLLDSLTLPGKPWRLIYAASTAPARPDAEETVETSALTQTSQADETGDSPAASLAAPKKSGLFRGCFEGLVWNQADGSPLAQASVWALNRLGKRYEGRVDEKGRYRVEDLPWGTYIVEAEAPGFSRLSLAEQTLALKGEVVLDLKLQPISDASKKNSTKP